MVRQSRNKEWQNGTGSGPCLAWPGPGWHLREEALLHTPPEQPAPPASRGEAQLSASSAATPDSPHCFLQPHRTGCPSGTEPGFSHSVSPICKSPGSSNAVWPLSAQQTPTLEDNSQGNSQTCKSAHSLENCVVRARAHPRAGTHSLMKQRESASGQAESSQTTEATLASNTTLLSGYK